MDHETVLRAEIEKVGRPVLVVRVPAKESADLRAVRSFIMDSLALGVLVVGQGVGLSLEYLPDLGGVACTWDSPWDEDEPGIPEKEQEEDPVDMEPVVQHVGHGAREKNQILTRLTTYRKSNGLGCLAKVAALAGAPVTEETLREMLTGGKKLPLSQWQQVGRALDALEQEDSHE